jgi:hypothetical protein
MLHGEVQWSHARTKSEYTLAPVRALEQRHLAIEPRPSPPSRPFVLYNEGYLCPTTPVLLRVKVEATELSLHDGPINFHHFWLVVQLIPLGESIGGGNTSEAS